MELMPNKIYLLSRLELAVLLLAAGKENVCSLALPKVAEIDDMKMVGAAFRLTKDGLLDVKVDASVLSGNGAEKNAADDVNPSREAMEFLAPVLEAQRVIEIVPHDREADQRFLYVTEERVTVIAADVMMKDQIRVRSFGRGELGSWFIQAFDLEENLPESEEAGGRYMHLADPEDIELENLRAARRPELSDMQEWMSEVERSSRTNPVFALRFLRSSDGAAVRYGMLVRGKLGEWRLECQEGDLLSSGDEMQVWPAFEGMWADL